MKTSHLVLACVMAATLPGCATMGEVAANPLGVVFDEAGQGMSKLVGTAVSNSSEARQYATPDTGVTISSGALGGGGLTTSLNQILRPMSAQDRKYFLSAFFLVAKVETCKAEGYPSWPRTKQAMYTKIPPRKCTYNKNMQNFMRHSMEDANNYLDTGRMDGVVQWTETRLISGTRSGGWDRATSIARFDRFSGPYVAGKSRTDISEEFVTILNGANMAVPKAIRG